MKTILRTAVATFIAVPVASAHAVPATRVDPALQFVISSILGQTQAVRKLVPGSVSQHARQPVLQGKSTISAQEFVTAIAACPISDFRNVSAGQSQPPDLFVGWHCQDFALEARVKGAGNHVVITDFEKLPYIAPPPAPPPPPKDSQ